MNDELHARNEELTRVNADLLNLLASVQIAIVIVARDLRIRRFTPMAEKKFNLIPNDVGRPFSQISTTLKCPELPNLITETIDTVFPSNELFRTTVEKPTCCASGRTRRRTTASTAPSSRSSISSRQNIRRVLKNKTRPTFYFLLFTFYLQIT